MESSPVLNKDHFEWMVNKSRDRAYVSYLDYSGNSTCSFDLGHDGCAASCNYGGELLQMTARSEDHGILFARDDFEYSLYLSIGRAQRERGGKATFGLKMPAFSEIAKEDSPRFCLGNMIDRGTFNYRWPHNEYSLVVNQPNPGSLNRTQSDFTCYDTILKTERDAIEVGTCATMTFAKDGTLYQVLRMDEKCRPDAKVCYKAPDDVDLILEIEPPLRFQNFPGLRNTNDGKEFLLQSDAFFYDLKLSSDNSCAFMKGDLGRGVSIVWQASLSEYNIETGQCVDIPLEEVLDRRQVEHISNGSNKSLPVYRAKFGQARNNPHLRDFRHSEAHIRGSRVFLAAFQLYESAEVREPKKVPHLTPGEMIEFLGIRSTSPLATAASLQAMFLRRQESMECISGLGEVDLVGRCLEKILEVDLVPAAFPSTTWASRPLSLVSNLFLKAQVNLKALFWKTRFLVKFDEFLSRIIKHEKHISEGFQQPQDIAQTWPIIEKGWYELQSSDVGRLRVELAMIQRIRYAISNIMAYLVRAFLEPHENDHPLLPELDPAGGDSKYYYVMLTMCFVAKHYPRVKWAWQKDVEESGEKWQLGLLGGPKRLPSQKLNPLPSDRSMRAVTKEKDSLLKWFHHESVASLQSQYGTGRLIPKTWEADRSKIIELRTNAKTALTRRLSSGQPYRAEDEIIDRLAFLAAELWPELPDAKMIADRVTRRIETSGFTRTIEISPPPRGEGGYTGSPWEIHALCHHSRLVVSYRKLSSSKCSSSWREGQDELEHFRRKFSPFLTAEVSLVPCWERSNSASRRGFLLSEATAVLGSTILDIFIRDITHSDEHEQGLFSGVDAAMNKKGFAEHINQLKCTGEPATVEDLLALQLDALERISSSKDPEARIDYLVFKPPQQHHTEDFFNSLDDTPRLYVAPQIESIHVPVGIRRALSKGRFRNDEIKRLPTKLRDMLLPELKYPLLLEHEYFDYETLQQLKNVAERALLKGNPSESEKQLFPPEVQKLLHVKLTKNQWLHLLKALKTALATVEFKHKDIKLNWLTDGEKEAMQSLKIIDIKACGTPSHSPPAPVTSGINELADSLIDQEVRHRILVAPTCRKLQADLLRLFTYVLHPEMIDCFENHTMRVSKFVLQKKTSVAHITIQSWALEGSTKKFAAAASDSVLDTPRCASDDEMIIMPERLKKAFRDSREAQYHDSTCPNMELKVSSIGISTNEFGDFSRCTVITDLIPQHKLVALAERVESIWDNFVHQPQAGRFLVFSVILACICEEMAKQYDKAVREFVKKLKFNNLSATYLTDSKWLQSKLSVSQLQLSLWSLEALNILSNTIADTVGAIAKAKADLDKEIKWGPGKRSDELERLCLSHQEPLERSLAELTAVQIKLEQKVELNSRYANALSTVLALRDSRASYKQNNTIQKLTYITIGCLPIGLTSALFAVPKDQNVLHPEMGLKWFIWVSVMFFVTIFTIAMVLGTVISTLEHVKEYWMSHVWAKRMVPLTLFEDYLLMPIWQWICAQIDRLHREFTQENDTLSSRPSPRPMYSPGEIGGVRRSRTRRSRKQHSSVRSSDESLFEVNQIRTIEDVA